MKSELKSFKTETRFNFRCTMMSEAELRDECLKRSIALQSSESRLDLYDLLIADELKVSSI